MELTGKYWSDILLAIEAIEQYMAGITSFDGYSASPMVKDAVERRFIIIGEAINKLVQLAPEDVIEDAQRIRAFRNRLVHSYDAIDDAAVWIILQKYLPALKAEAMKKAG